MTAVMAASEVGLIVCCYVAPTGFYRRCDWASNS